MVCWKIPHDNRFSQLETSIEFGHFPAIFEDNFWTISQLAIFGDTEGYSHPLNRWDSKVKNDP